MVRRFYAKTHSLATVFPLAGLWVLLLPLLLVLFDRLLCILSLLLLLLQIVFPCLGLTGLIRGLHRTRLGRATNRTAAMSLVTESPLHSLCGSLHRDLLTAATFYPPGERMWHRRKHQKTRRVLCVACTSVRNAVRPLGTSTLVAVSSPSQHLKTSPSPDLTNVSL
jgi:hypothetical protein